ncbi:hypothetical protein IE81DRAFT_345481 [Ceraceosorus guamensis]|uniref:Uncharacterized protein n=1 Tax=Ceraceosorus guamensis TaxID=1522189 RepID=A0A316WAX9_9BASI|nr:hypothetical protein IE81DRAFT_345481 [Ceraceosorus guamensis]PWN44795.1 hypothetical protein IE81DRAFT_345481 [Ceraceosorus guamensis]
MSNPTNDSPSFDLSNEWASSEEPKPSEVEVAKQQMASLGLTAMEPFFGASPQQSTLLAQQSWALHQAKKTSPATPSKVPRCIPSFIPSFQPSGMPVAKGSGSGPPSAAPALQTLPTTSPLRLPVASLRVPGSKLRGVKLYAALQPRPIPPYKPLGMPATQDPGSSAGPSGAPSPKVSPTTSPSCLPVASLRVPGSKLYAAFQTLLQKHRQQEELEGPSEGSGIKLLTNTALQQPLVHCES